MKENNFFPTIIWRHRKENLKKCSLRGLESRLDFQFFTYPYHTLPSLDQYILLAIDAPPLTVADKGHGLFLIDATWRYAEVMLGKVPQSDRLIYRSLPKGTVTAYPRRQEDCSDPGAGLASIEALYAAHCLLEKSTANLLDHYYWGNLFLERNPHLQPVIVT